MGKIRRLFFIFVLAILIWPIGVYSAGGLADSAWPTFAGNSKHTGLSPFKTNKIDGTIKWTFQADGMVQSSPVLASDGTIYIADGKCNLYAISAKGKEKWKFNGGEPIHSTEWEGYHCNQSTPAVAADGTIYFYPMTGNFYAINPDGTEKWRFPMFTFTNIWPSPTIGPDGTVYVSSEFYPPRETGKPQETPACIYAINPDGTEKWKYAPGEFGGGAIAPITVADDGTLYLASGEFDPSIDTFSTRVFAFNPDGTIKWKFWPHNGVLEGAVSVGDDGTIYFGAKGMDDPRAAKFYAVNPDGTQKWVKDFTQGISITPAISSDGTLYFGDWGGTFYALNSADGSEKWHVQTPSAYEALSSSPAIGAEGTIYFGTIAKEFYAYNPDGTQKWKLSIQEGGVNTSPAIGEDGTIYFASVPGKLYAIGRAGQAQSTGVTDNSTNSLLKVLSVVVGILFIAFVALGILFKKNRKIFWVAAIVFLTVTIVLTILRLSGPHRDSNSDTKKNTPLIGPAVDNESGGSGTDSPCPHHIYGTDANSYYGAFGMETRDLSDSDVSWIRENCSNTTWPDTYAPK